MKTAVILCAGQGRKMWPYGATRNKAMLPIANRPLVLWQVESLVANGIEKIIIVVDYRQEQIISLFSQDSRVSYISASSVSGTVPALLSAWPQVQDDSVLVCYGDVLFTFEDVQALIKVHQTHKPLATVLVQPLQEQKPNEWLCAQVSDNKVDYVLGHPRDSVSHRFAGVYAMNKHFMPFLKSNPGRMEAIQVGMMPSEEAHIEASIQIAIEQKQEITAAEAGPTLIDLDKPWHLLQANYNWIRYLSQKLVKPVIADSAKISDRAVIKGHVVIGENSEIGDGVIIEGNVWIGANSRVVQGAILEKDVVIGDHCTVRRYAQIEEGTSVGDHCFIGHCAEVAGVMMRNVYAYHYGEYWGILGEACDLGAATVCGNLRFDDGQTVHHVQGHRETPLLGANAAYLGDYVRTGVNAILMPGVKIGPYCVIGAGTIVNEDLAERSLLYIKQEQVRKTWGPERYGW
jgi:UDP-N-acetylglucosamine diphosphorylase / glucose-1-phosphate thymidylyltransferase / UDP-N-acetylgalactosamine diphosphorylase / glucosamine-1-phosphate N-acetyltransferase / galactosamine-1-phosphate N-acetyltransferase